MKTVYLVRHGESEGNANDYIQSPTTPLSRRGRAQARQLAGRCEHLGIEHILASTMKRAATTAQIIAKRIRIPITSMDLLGEKRQISAHHNRMHSDPQAQEAHDTWWQRFGEKDFRIADEENFADLKARGLSILQLLESRPESVLLVVSHGLILRTLLGCLLLGDDLTPLAGQRILRGFRTNNTGLSEIQYDASRQPQHWSVAVWNDHAHLGE